MPASTGTITMAHHRYTQDPARDPELVTSGTPRTGASICSA